MNKACACIAATSVLLASCGGGAGSGPVDVVQVVVPVTRLVLTRCLLAPSSPDELLLGCLAGTTSSGTDAFGKDCNVSFSGNALQLITRDFQGSIPYQRNPSAGHNDTTYLYTRDYDPNSGAFNFAVAANSGGVVYFGFSFASNAETGKGSATFSLELAPPAPGLPKVAIQCAVKI